MGYGRVVRPRAPIISYPPLACPVTLRDMCRSIKTLRPPFADEVTEADVHAAALQYVRKISGFRAPAKANADAFNEAVEQIAVITADLLGRLEVRPAPQRVVVEG
jgi:hypothetical protein